MSEFETKDSGARAQFDSGMQRDTEDGKPRFDLMLPLDIPYEEQMLTRLAALYGRGAVKYESRNWEQANSIVEMERMKSSAFRHFMQWMSGEVDEDHAAAVMFNIIAWETTKYKVDQTALRKVDNDLYETLFGKPMMRGIDEAVDSVDDIDPDVSLGEGISEWDGSEQWDPFFAEAIAADYYAIPHAIKWRSPDPVTAKGIEESLIHMRDHLFVIPEEPRFGAWSLGDLSTLAERMRQHQPARFVVGDETIDLEHFTVTQDEYNTLAENAIKVPTPLDGRIGSLGGISVYVEGTNACDDIEGDGITLDEDDLIVDQDEPGTVRFWINRWFNRR